MISDLSPRDVTDASKKLPAPFVNFDMPDHTQSIVTNAQEVLSTARSVLSESSRSASCVTDRTTSRRPVHVNQIPGSTTDCIIPPETRDRIFTWIPSQHAVDSLSNSEIRPGTVTPDTAFSASTPTEEIRQGESSGDEDNEVEAVSILLEMGADHLSNSNFSRAEDCLKKGIAKAESVNSNTPKRLDLDSQRLWLAFCQLFQGKASDALPTLTALSEAKSNSEYDTIVALWAVYGLAWVHMFDVRKPDCHLAEFSCRKIMKALHRTYGDHSKYCELYHHSLSLRAVICINQGDTATASAYVDHLQEFECSKKLHIHRFSADVREPTISEVQQFGCKVRKGMKSPSTSRNVL